MVSIVRLLVSLDTFNVWGIIVAIVPRELLLYICTFASAVETLERMNAWVTEANLLRGNRRREVLRHLLGKPDRRCCHRRLGALFYPSRENQEDWEEGQFGGGGWPVDGRLVVGITSLLEDRSPWREHDD